MSVTPSGVLQARAQALHAQPIKQTSVNVVSRASSRGRADARQHRQTQKGCGHRTEEESARHRRRALHARS